ncbi:hypothetical protein T4B_7950 [Trichinella pseudospiralis]|uniref:Uncharacterized protein n=1 Tax=Trichinella pseudospiralis TaxID=6337 RepID=A0A0V1HHE6_TRIPS|nr:hypothetical protein T4B_7950 [Trichinella pseudospiralis]
MVTNKVWVFDGVNCIGTLTSSSCDDSMQKEAIHWIRQMQKSNEEALRLRRLLHKSQVKFTERCYIV